MSTAPQTLTLAGENYVVIRRDDTSSCAQPRKKT